MDACNKLGEFTITGVERARKGEPKVCTHSPFAGFILLHELFGIYIWEVLTSMGVLQVEVTFSLDANGILSVTAQDTVTGAKAGAEIKAKDGRLSADEIDRMVQDAEKHRAQDEELADKVR